MSSNPLSVRAITIALGVMAFIGVSSSVSPWIDALYSEIAIWVLGGAAVFGAIWAAVIFWPDLELNREVRQSWAQNDAAVQALAARHAKHPEVAKELSARLLEEKLARLQVVPPTQPPAKG